MHEDGRHPPSRGASRASLGGRDKVQLVEHANVERRPPPAQRAVERLVKRLGFAALELVEGVEEDARRPVDGPRHDEARAEAQPRRAFGAVAVEHVQVATAALAALEEGKGALRLDSVVAPAPPLGGAISERLHEHRAAAPLVRLGRPSSSRERLKARLVAADVEPIDALDDFVRRKGQRAYRVRASIRDDVVGLQHKYDLMKQMVEGRPAPRPREKTGRR